MAFPLSLPGTPSGPTVLTIRPRSITAMTKSEFTGGQQVVAQPGQWWELDFDLPPMERAIAETWVAFLLKLDGLVGTFLLGDFTGETARGSLAGTPIVKGATQTGGELITDGWDVSEADVMLAGDYFSLGSGTSTRLYKVLDDASSDGSGDSTLTIWPDLRTAPGDNDPLDVTAAKGTFRLMEEPEYSISRAQHFGIRFTAIEAI